MGTVPAAAPLICAGAAVLAYILMDGWVLGTGILYPLVARRADRELLCDAIAPFWNAGKTWLALGALVLLFVLGAAYSRVLRPLYFPTTLMLLVLGVRAVSNEFRQRGGLLRRIWAWLFPGGAILSTLAQGYIAGYLIEELGGNMAGSEWAQCVKALFPMVCSVGLLSGYALLGACWLIAKADGALQVMGREVSHSTLLLTTAILLVVCLLAPLVSAPIAQRWSDSSIQMVLLGSVAVAGVMIARLWRSLWGNATHRPRQWAVALLIVVAADMAVILDPFRLPHPLTRYALEYAPAHLKYAIMGLCVVLLMILLYLPLSYRELRAKARRINIPAMAGHALAARRTIGNNSDLHLS